MDPLTERGQMAAEEQAMDATFDKAMSEVRKAYYSHVRDLAACVVEELRESGEKGEDAREWLIERLHETCDGDGWVIYTARAQMILLASDNESAYINDFGTEGVADETGSINWSVLAYAALHRDIIEDLESRHGLDVNDPAPEDEEDDDEDDDDEE